MPANFDHIKAMNKELRYYIAQVVGWSAYVILASLFFILSGTELSLNFIGGIYLVFALGIVVTHMYRSLLIRWRWLERDIIWLIPRVLLACMVLAIGFHITYIFIGNLVFEWDIELNWLDANLFTWAMLFFIWNLIYFAYIFFQRYRREEIKNLQLESAKNEYELRRLRDQMNPHFIFNAMNTVRALIDEDPKGTKKAVTQLSNVLRSSLQTGKRNLITLQEEINIVRDYLEIEMLRYEERLKVSFNIAPGSESIKVPPLLLQTLVENGIKHGISKLPDGGIIAIHTKVVEDRGWIIVLNSGRFESGESSGTSLGIANTRDRLQLSFGEKAELTITNSGDSQVKTTIVIPIIHNHEHQNTDR